MADLNSWPGYRHLSLVYGTRTFESAESKMWGNGFYKPRNLEAGALVVGEMNLMGQFCFAMETRGSVRHLFGKKDEPREWKKKGKC